MSRFLLCLSCLFILPAVLRADLSGKFTPEEIAEARTETLEAVKGLVPVKAGAPPVETTNRGPYILHGRLFGGSAQWALVDLSKGVAAAKWVKGKWVFSDAWQIPILWKGSHGEDDPRSLVDKLPHKPFWLRKLWKDAPPFLVVPTEFDRYHFEHQILRFDPEAGRIHAPELFSILEPEARGNYLCLTRLSPRKAWWHQTVYYRRRGNTFTFTASWKHDVTDPEVIVLTAEKPGSKPGKTIVFHATDSDSGYQIREGDQKIGSIEFLPPKTGTEGKAKELWLFQALTGLPSLAYGDKINGKDTAKVKAAMKRLRPAVKGEVLRRRMGLEKK